MIEAAGAILGLLAIWLMLCDMRSEFAGPLLLAGGVLLVIAGMAHAHDHGRPGLDPWFKALTSRAGALCCDGTDATRLDDVDWESKDGRYRVRIDGKWIDVPESAVVDGPNKAGPAMVWPVEGYGVLTIRCFMPGSMS